MRKELHTPLALLVLLTACGESKESANTSKDVPGPSAAGWQRAYTDGGVGLSCDSTLEETIDANAPRVEVGSATLVVGFEQIGDNQNPLFLRFDDGQKIYCVRHEDDPPDGRAVGLTWDGGDTAYIVYTIVGGGSDLEGKSGWLDAYAPGAISGGGPKVSYLGRVDVKDGSLTSGTFIISVKSDNKVNSHGPLNAPTVLEDGTVVFEGESAHKPIDPAGNTSMECSDYPFTSRYVFAPDLATLACASSTNCTSSRPCGL